MCVQSLSLWAEAARARREERRRARTTTPAPAAEQAAPPAADAGAPTDHRESPELVGAGHAPG